MKNPSATQIDTFKSIERNQIKSLSMENITNFLNKTLHKILKDRGTSNAKIFDMYLQLILLCKRILE